MIPQRPILVYEQDRCVLASLQFGLTVEGYRVLDGTSEQADPRWAVCLIIEQRRDTGDGLTLLTQLRAGIALVDKPLLTDDLPQALRSALGQQERARRLTGAGPETIRLPSGSSV